MNAEQTSKRVARKPTRLYTGGVLACCGLPARVVRIFSNPASCLRLIRALCVETREGWLEDHRYLNMEFLKEQKKALLQPVA